MHASSVRTDPASAGVDSACKLRAFDEFMNEALYAPGSGYYAKSDTQFGHGMGGGAPDGDFVTAPELSPAFGWCLGEQIQPWLDVVDAAGAEPCITELGAGSGKLMLQLSQHQSEWMKGQSGKKPSKLQILEVSGALRNRQQKTLAGHGVRWLDRLPSALSGVVVANEVLDAMPCKLLIRKNGRWHERHVASAHGQHRWQDLPTDRRPPIDIAGGHDYATEIHLHAEACILTLAQRMKSAVALFIDYGFGEAEYYHPQRHMGTLMCHRAHRSDPDPLQDVGQKDITCHVNFTGIAMAAQRSGLDVVGYTSQGRFLLNCGVLQHLQGKSLAYRANAQKLITEHEMGELFKVIALCTPDLTATLADSMGFAAGDRTHTL